MKTLQKIFANGAEQYLHQFARAMPSVQRKALGSLKDCRTPRMGKNLFACPECGIARKTNRSCSNRHCPTCQYDKGLQWFDTHHKRMLPCNYFMVTFTVPQSLRRLIRSNQRDLYAAMFTSAWQSMCLLAKDKRLLGAHILGAVAVLHTWTRTLEYHPHIHFLVPAGGLDKHGQWIRGRQDFFLPVRALSRIFRAKMRDTIKKLYLFKQCSADIWQTDWNVNCENKGNGIRSLLYLSEYLFRVAISNSRIARADENSVTFRYKKEKSDKYKTMTVKRTEFLRRFLQHVLPHGFVKVRHYGFLSANSKQPIEKIVEMITEGFSFALKLKEHKPLYRRFTCECGAEMKLIKMYLPQIDGSTIVVT